MDRRFLCYGLFIGFIFLSVPGSSQEVEPATSASLRSGDTILIKAPPILAALIARHVDAIHDKEYAAEISWQDLFHGHLIRKKTHAGETLPEDIAQEVSAILYHSAERNDRWEIDIARGKTYETINHRSLVGLSNGRVNAAYFLIDWNKISPKRQSQFGIGGTLWVSDLINQFPHWSSLTWAASRASESQKVTINFAGESRILTLIDQFILLPIIDGRFTTSKGQSYEIYLAYHSGEVNIRRLDGPEFGYVVDPSQGYPYKD